MLYLASPYTHEDKTVEEARYIIANQYFAYLMDTTNQPIFAPIPHSHAASKLMVNTKTYDWLDADLQILKICSCLYVLEIPGWLESTGMSIEIKTALKLRLPIVFVSIGELKECHYIDQELLSRLTKSYTTRSKDFFLTGTSVLY